MYTGRLGSSSTPCIWFFGSFSTHLGLLDMSRTSGDAASEQILYLVHDYGIGVDFRPALPGAPYNARIDSGFQEHVVTTLQSGGSLLKLFTVFTGHYPVLGNSDIKVRVNELDNRISRLFAGSFGKRLRHEEGDSRLLF